YECRVNRVELHRQHVELVELPSRLDAGRAARHADAEDLPAWTVQRNGNTIVETGRLGFRKDAQLALAEISRIDDLLPGEGPPCDGADAPHRIALDIAAGDVMLDPIIGIVAHQCWLFRSTEVALSPSCTVHHAIEPEFADRLQVKLKNLFGCA